MAETTFFPMSKVELPDGGLPERPIESCEEDELGRQPFVRRLASALIDGQTSRSRGVVIGITGPWGSGKSSILNLLRESLKADHPEAVVVSFDPWLISGRNDLISEFIKELLVTVKSEPTAAEKLGSVTDTLVKYGKELGPAIGAWLGAGPLVKGGLDFVQSLRARDESLSALRKELSHELSQASVPIVVLIDELDRIEDHEIRTVAQLVRSVADFPGISYVLAYDHDRVVQALGQGASEDQRTERGRAYLEKIVQLQIPLPVTFAEELSRLLSADLTRLQRELCLPDNFQELERYKELIQLLETRVIETPRDIKRLVGTFHVLGGMVIREVDWIDLLTYSALAIKAPKTVDAIRSDPTVACGEFLGVRAFGKYWKSQQATPQERVSNLIQPAEDNEGVRNLISFLFPLLSDRPRSIWDSPDAIRHRRPLLTTLRLGLLPGGYSKAEILSLVRQTPDEVAQSLRIAYDNNRLGSLIDRLADLYCGLTDINHVWFWKGVAKFVRKPDCEWMTSFQPMPDVIHNFARMLLLTVQRNDSFKSIALDVFTNLRNDNEDVLTAQWLRSQFSIYGLFGSSKGRTEGAFLTLEQTEAVARDMSSALLTKHLRGLLIPCRWELGPVYTMLATGTWGGPCRKQLDDALADDRALDGFTLMLYGAFFTTGRETVEKMCTYDAYIQRVIQRLASPTINDAHQSVRDALEKAKRGG
jgi:hypothetical protein